MCLHRASRKTFIGLVAVGVGPLFYNDLRIFLVDDSFDSFLLSYPLFASVLARDFCELGRPLQRFAVCF